MLLTPCSLLKPVLQLLLVFSFVSSSSGDSKSGEKLAAKQVLNRTVTQEIPTMDSSKILLLLESAYYLYQDDITLPSYYLAFVKILYQLKSEDGKKYTFKLRKDAKWSNGDPVTAKDFVYAWQS
jgi:oligopeptide transport system substrate-binding protein